MIRGSNGRQNFWSKLLALGGRFIKSFPWDIYRLFLLCLPDLYESRVRNHGILEVAQSNDAAITVVYGAGVYIPSPNPSAAPPPFTSNNISPESKDLVAFRDAWGQFISTLLEEWKVLNVVSALLSASVLALLALDGALDDPITRTAGTISLVCALWSIVYSSVYIVRFSQMTNRLRRAAGWAEAARSSTSKVWSVWVLLAMPVFWLMWSLISFMIAIMSFVWRTHSVASPELRMTSVKEAVATRIAISCVVGLGSIYLLAVLEAFRHYGSEMDQKWLKKAAGRLSHPLPPPSPLMPGPIYRPSYDGAIAGVERAATAFTHFDAFPVILLNDTSDSWGRGIPSQLYQRGMRSEVAWNLFVETVKRAWLDGFCFTLDIYGSKTGPAVCSPRQAVYYACMGWAEFKSYEVSVSFGEEEALEDGSVSCVVWMRDSKNTLSLGSRPVPRVEKALSGLRDGVRVASIWSNAPSLNGDTTLVETIRRAGDGSIAYGSEVRKLRVNPPTSGDRDESSSSREQALAPDTEPGISAQVVDPLDSEQPLERGGSDVQPPTAATDVPSPSFRIVRDFGAVRPAAQQTAQGGGITRPSPVTSSESNAIPLTTRHDAPNATATTASSSVSTQPFPDVTTETADSLVNADGASNAMTAAGGTSISAQPRRIAATHGSEREGVQEGAQTKASDASWD
ncbi:hypothetical protein PENSPDRAFT_735559 [Peniophora sp. CONT]|nr:hypothetical protein PENSPDRAFT_735559 [Peniophora sp. CONT]